MQNIKLKELLSDLVTSIVGSEIFSIYTRKSNPNIIVFAFPNVGLITEIEENTIKPYGDDSISMHDWQKFAIKVESALNQEIWNLLITDLDKINKATQHFASLGPHESFYPSNLEGKRISEEDLYDTCAAIFVGRFATICKAVNTLAETSIE